MIAFLLLSVICSASAHSGQNEPMILPFNGWKAIEVVTEGDLVNGSVWRIPDDMDGMGAFLVNSDRLSDATLRLHVNHEDDGEATISEINLHKGRLKRAIAHTVMTNTSIWEEPNKEVVSSLNFVQSARVAYDRWTPDGGVSWKTIGSDITDPEGAGGFCRFCSSQYYPPNAFGSGRGFADAVYITGEECDNGRLFALDVHDVARDLYLVSGVTGSLSMVASAPPTIAAPVNGTTINNPQYQFQEGHGGMTYDSWENAAAIDTGETEHIALLLAADEGTETLKLYIGKKNTDMMGNPNPYNFLARNGLLYGRWYYLSVFEWEQDPITRLWKSMTPGTFVTNQNDAWSEPKFEDIDTNPQNPKQIVMAESNSGVYILDFDLKFDPSKNFEVMESSFSVKMISNSDHNDGLGRIQYPDNVDWTKNNLIFVNKDDRDGGVWYMNSDGSGKVQIGETQSGGESTGILDISELLNYPPAFAVMTTNQGYPSSMTLLLNPNLKSFIEENKDYVPLPIPPPPVVPATPLPSTLPPSLRPTSQPIQITSSPVSPPIEKPSVSLTVAPTSAPTEESSSAFTSVPSPVVAPLLPPTFPPISPIVPDIDILANCPVSDKDGLFQVIQAEDAISLYGVIKTKATNFCGIGYVDFRDIEDGYSPVRGDTGGVGNRRPVFSQKDGIDQPGDSIGSVSRQGTYNKVVGISFPVQIFRPGIYKVSIRYANGGDLKSSRPGILLIDDDYFSENFEFAATFGWSIWSIESKMITFDSEGDHSIDLFWTETRNRPIIDWLSFDWWRPIDE